MRVFVLLALLLQLLPLPVTAAPARAVLGENGSLVLADGDICHPGDQAPALPAALADCCHGLPCIMGAALVPSGPVAGPAGSPSLIMVAETGLPPGPSGIRRRPYASRAPPRIG